MRSMMLAYTFGEHMTLVADFLGWLHAPDIKISLRFPLTPLLLQKWMLVFNNEFARLSSEGGTGVFYPDFFYGGGGD